MAKTPKLKKKEPTVNSRAAKRKTTSPPPPTLAAKAPADNTTEQPWLHHAQNAGISKRKIRRQKSRQQRLRREQGLEQGHRNTDRLEKKVADSKSRRRKTVERRAGWDELNGTTLKDGEQKDKEDDVDEAYGEEKPQRGKTWTEKMVDVELKEAADDIEGLELPLPKPEAESEKTELQGNPFALKQAVTAPVAEDLDEVT